jgi:uncharacterized protein (TIGR02246 family)
MAAAVLVGVTVFQVFANRQHRINLAGAAVEQRILAAHQQMVNAAESLDAEALYANVIDSPTFLLTDGQLLSRSAALEQTRAGFRRLTRLKYAIRERHIDVLSPSLALVILTGTIHSETRDGRSAATEFAQTQLLTLREGRWQVLHTHQSNPAPRQR